MARLADNARACNPSFDPQKIKITRSPVSNSSCRPWLFPFWKTSGAFAGRAKNVKSVKFGRIWRVNPRTCNLLPGRQNAIYGRKKAATRGNMRTCGEITRNVQRLFVRIGRSSSTPDTAAPFSDLPGIPARLSFRGWGRNCTHGRASQLHSLHVVSISTRTPVRRQYSAKM